MYKLEFELQYHEDSAKVFGKIAHRPWAVFLDSGWPDSPYGRYDIFSADPFLTLTTTGKVTEICTRQQLETSTDDPFALLKNTLSCYQAVPGELPFSGGAMGYFGYDLARRIESLEARAVNAEEIPEMAVGIYDWAVVVDHDKKRTRLISHARNADTEIHWVEICALFDDVHGDTQSLLQGFKATSPVTSNMDQAHYEAAFNRVKAYISEGDCYQVNLAQRFVFSAEGDPWMAYQALRQLSPAPFSAYLNTPEVQVLSASPECFLHVENAQVTTKPIKGTRPRAANPTEDEQLAIELQASLKDRAENLMIVDLLRNDIGKNCAIGSVKADQLFELESFANVHHLVSTVTGRLEAGHDAIDLLRGCFPGGSITGAPKLRAMEIIEELEPNRRGIYCGAIGYLGYDGNMDTSIAIRTAVYSNQTFRFWAGGGLVADSEAGQEYKETWDKASSMLKLAEMFGSGDVGR